MHPLVRRCAFLVVAVLCIGKAAAKDPMEGAAQGPQPVDLRVESLLSRLQGTYKCENLTLHISTIATMGLPPSVYVEITRAGSELRPMVRQVWSAYIGGDKPKVRVSEFSQGTTTGQIYLAEWASPESFPMLDASRVDTLGDLDVAEGANGVSLTSPHAFGVNRDGAWNLRFDVRLTGDGLEWRMTGLDQQEGPVWGEDVLSFKRAENDVKAVINADGLVIIDLRPGEGHKASTGDAVALNYNAYTMAGVLFSSTNVPGGKFLTTRLPADYIVGFTEGVLGMAAPGVRRFIVPPALCVGPNGEIGMAPSNSFLIYDIDMISVKD